MKKPVGDKSLVDKAVATMLDRILRGEFVVGEPLPPESELAAQLNVSRLTFRETISVLRTQGVVQVQRGRGTYLNNYPEWEASSPIVQAVSRADSDANVGFSLLQIRRFIETGAAESFAKMRSDADLASMEQYIEEMDLAHESSDGELFAQADILFHNVFLLGCDNMFVPMVFRPINQELNTYRVQTSSDPIIRLNAQVEHRKILSAIRDSDPDGSREAVNAHIEQTTSDFLRRVIRLDGPRTALPSLMGGDHPS